MVDTPLTSDVPGGQQQPELLVTPLGVGAGAAPAALASVLAPIQQLVMTAHCGALSVSAAAATGAGLGCEMAAGWGACNVAWGALKAAAAEAVLATATRTVDRLAASTFEEGSALHLQLVEEHAASADDSHSCGGVVQVSVLAPQCTHGMAAGGEVRLVARPPGSLGNLVPEAVPAASNSGAPEAAVRVHAVGLNFRDLLVVS
eukprot:355897-Chlamydomonas_euryale.AAC.1